MIRHTLIALILAAAPFATAQEKKPAVPAKAKEAAEKVKEKVAEAKEKAETKKADAKKTDAAATDAADKALLDHAAKELKKLTPTQTKKLLDLLNDGKPADLQQMPGIGEAKAEAVKKARPFKSADQLIMVEGVGEATFDGIVKWTKDGMASADAAKEKEAPKKEEKKPEPKKESSAKKETKK